MDLSICMIVKDEEKNIQRCLESMDILRKNLKSEIIIVDTGSEDSTINIAKQYDVNVYNYIWQDDFSKARNYGLRYSKGKWVLIIDADEEIENAEELISFIENNKDEKIGAIAILFKDIDLSNVENYSEYMIPRIFKGNENLLYEGAIHEQPIYSGDVAFFEKFTLKHYGYSSGNYELKQKKFKRNYELLEKEIKKNPKNIYYLYQISSTLRNNGKKEKAKEFIEDAYKQILEKKNQKEYIYIYKHYIKLLIDFQNWEEVIEKVDEAISIFGRDLDLMYFKAGALNMMNDLKEAELYYQAYLEKIKEYRGQKHNDCKNSYDSIMLERQAILDYAEVLIKQDKLDQSIKFLENVKIEHVMITLLKVRLYFELGNYGKIQELLNDKLVDEFLVFEFFYKNIMDKKSDLTVLNYIKWSGTLLQITKILKKIIENGELTDEFKDFILKKTELYMYNFMIDIIGRILEKEGLSLGILKGINVNNIRKLFIKLEKHIGEKLYVILIEKLKNKKTLTYLDELKVIMEIQSFLIYKNKYEDTKDFLSNLKVYISNICKTNIEKMINDSYGLEFEVEEVEGDLAKNIASIYEDIEELSL